MQIRRWSGRLVAGLGLALAVTALSGCQTWTSGMTLPSGHYLEHPPQYFPPSPPFPLPRELAAQERAAAGVPDNGLPAGPLPSAVPGNAAGGGPPPVPGVEAPPPG